MNKFFITFSLFISFFIFNNVFGAEIRFAVYYSDKLPFTDFQKYSVIVFDSDYHPQIKGLVGEQKTVLGYLSVGEMEKYKWYFSKFKDSGLLLNQDDNWEGSYAVDIRNKKWVEFLIYTEIPKIIRSGFNGIFLDTMDTSISLEESNPIKYKGMTEAAINIVKSIHHNYPSLKIMMNRGYKILPSVANDINMELGEGVYSDYNFKAKKYELVPKEDYLEQVKILKNAKKLNPHLEIFTLDYCDSSDKEMISKIYKIEQANGFVPYVSTIDLDDLTNE